ncbi:PRODH [Bugula neritina]|uniref:Proline dehydrogenase n=1 Tax=Bugula neritina TaxID=10212 RepID=A0A7J7KHJ9_BUGNE|nr:PRODH [Bugula neritina]
MLRYHTAISSLRHCVLSRQHGIRTVSKLPAALQCQSRHSEPASYTKELLQKVDTQFEDKYKTVFRSKSRQQLVRAATVLWLCSFEVLVRHNQQLLKTSRKLLGKKLHEKLLQTTVYGQFVIGQKKETVKPIIADYLASGVGPILYYALEEDKSSHSKLGNDPFYASSVKSFKEAIDITSDAANKTGYIAVKPTALCSPNLWIRLTQVILSNTKSADFDSYHKSSDLIADSKSLAAEELEELEKLVKRGEEIIEYAASAGVKVMIDAEQTYFQPAIQRILGVEMMSRFNRESVNVLVTYQTYLKSAFENVDRDMEYCKREGIKFGARIVRGAYLDQERQLAQSNKYEDPTNPTFEATTRMYEKTAAHILNRISEWKDGDIEVMFGTHNEGTLRQLFTLLSESNPPLSSVCFGQLYGMCDHITFHLGELGIPVYKSMPYGPVDIMTSYLGRRAIENRGVLDKVKKERQLLNKEIRRRVWR